MSWLVSKALNLTLNFLVDDRLYIFPFCLKFDLDQTFNLFTSYIIISRLFLQLGSDGIRIIIYVMNEVKVTLEGLSCDFDRDANLKVIFYISPSGFRK